MALKIKFVHYNTLVNETITLYFNILTWQLMALTQKRFT